MPSPSSRPSPASRKFAWLAGGIVVACLLWTIGWFFFAMKVENHIPATLARLVGPSAIAQCTLPDVRGYPFRFGVFCDALSYENAAERITANAGAFRSAAQFYRPQHAVAEIDGPFTLNTPGLTMRTDWQLLQASIKAVSNGLDRASIDARNVNFDIDGSGLIQRLAFHADRITAHTRQNGPDLDVAAYGENLQNNLVPDLSAKATAFEATLSERSTLLEVPFQPLHGPFDAVLHRLSIEFDDASSLELSGPVQISADDRISGNLELTIGNLDRFLELAGSLNPEIAEALGRFGPMLSALDTRPGDEATTLPLTIRDNQVSLGLIPIGVLPSL